MGRSLPYIIIGLMVYMILFYLGNYQPKLVTDLLLQVDVFGVTAVARDEQDRLEKIKYLKDPDDPDHFLPDDKKQVLRNHTIFMGATTEMVKLALGNTDNKIERQDAAGNIIAKYYIYYLTNDRRPTVLVFQDDKLVNAYKTSVIDPDLKK